MIQKLGTNLQITKVANDVTSLLHGTTVITKVAETNSNNEFLYFVATALKADEANANGDLFPKDELEKSYETFIGKPLCMNHVASKAEDAVGKIIDAWWIPAEGNAHVLCLCKISRKLFPDLVKKIESGVLNSVSMGCSVSSAECSICGKTMSTSDEFCSHMSSLGREITTEAGEKKKVVSINRGISFNELSIVLNPACDTALVHQVYASKKDSNFEKLAEDTKVEDVEEQKLKSENGFVSEYKGYWICKTDSAGFRINKKDDLSDKGIIGMTSTVDQAKEYIDNHSKQANLKKLAGEAYAKLGRMEDYSKEDQSKYKSIANKIQDIDNTVLDQISTPEGYDEAEYSKLVNKALQTEFKGSKIPAPVYLWLQEDNYHTINELIARNDMFEPSLKSEYKDLDEKTKEARTDPGDPSITVKFENGETMRASEIMANEDDLHGGEIFEVNPSLEKDAVLVDQNGVPLKRDDKFNSDLVHAISYGPNHTKESSWETLLKQNPTSEDFYYIVLRAEEPYKGRAWEEFKNSNPDITALRLGALDFKEPYKSKAKAELEKVESSVVDVVSNVNQVSRPGFSSVLQKNLETFEENKKKASAKSVVQSMIDALANNTGKIPYTKKEGNWTYTLDANKILHIKYYDTEVITANFKAKKVTNVTNGGYDTTSTTAGINRTLKDLKDLGYEVPENWRKKEATSFGKWEPYGLEWDTHKTWFKKDKDGKTIFGILPKNETPTEDMGGYFDLLEVVKLKNLRDKEIVYSKDASIKNSLEVNKEAAKTRKADGEYKSDEDVEKEYEDYSIRQFKMNPSGKSGFLDLVFPHGEDMVDNFIIYDSGKIAFDHWYPENVYMELVNYINEHKDKQVETKSAAKEDNYEKDLSKMLGKSISIDKDTDTGLFYWECAEDDIYHQGFKTFEQAKKDANNYYSNSKQAAKVTQVAYKVYMRVDYSKEERDKVLKALENVKDAYEDFSGAEFTYVWFEGTEQEAVEAITKAIQEQGLDITASKIKVEAAKLIYDKYNMPTIIGDEVVLDNQDGKWIVTNSEEGIFEVKNVMTGEKRTVNPENVAALGKSAGSKLKGDKQPFKVEAKVEASKKEAAREKIVTLLTFEELTPEQQAKVIEKNRYINTEFDDWDQFVIEDVVQDLATKGYNDAKILYSGFGSQGDGASFTATIDLSKVLELLGLSDLSKVVSESVTDQSGSWRAYVKQSGRYYHENTMSVEIEYDGESKVEDKIPSMEAAILEDAKANAKEIYKKLENEYEGQQSDEAVKDTLIANEVEFNSETLKVEASKKVVKADTMPPKPDDASLSPNMKWVWNGQTKQYEQKPKTTPTTEVTTASDKSVDSVYKSAAVVTKTKMVEKIENTENGTIRTVKTTTKVIDTATEPVKEEKVEQPKAEEIKEDLEAEQVEEGKEASTKVAGVEGKTTEYYLNVARKLKEDGRLDEAVRAYDAAENHLPVDKVNETLPLRKEIMKERLEILENLNSKQASNLKATLILSENPRWIIMDKVSRKLVAKHYLKDLPKVASNLKYASTIVKQAELLKKAIQVGDQFDILDEAGNVTKSFTVENININEVSEDTYLKGTIDGSDTIFSMAKFLKLIEDGKVKATGTQSNTAETETTPEIEKSVESVKEEPKVEASTEVVSEAKKETPKERLEYLRQQLRNENISTDELVELQSLVTYIDKGDVELLEAAGVPEFPEKDASNSEWESKAKELMVQKDKLFNELYNVKSLGKAEKSAAYDDKKDYRKIDIFVDGEYECSTTWAKSLLEAKDKYLEKNPGIPYESISVIYSDKTSSKLAGKMVWFDVYLNDEEIDSIPYSEEADMTEEDVKKSLIYHDGYDPNIVVKKHASVKQEYVLKIAELEAKLKEATEKLAAIESEGKLKVEASLKVTAQLEDVTKKYNEAIEKVASMEATACLNKKVANCKAISEKAYDKGLLNVTDEMIKAEMAKGKNPIEAKESAIRQAIDLQVKSLLALDDRQIEAYNKVIENSAKKAYSGDSRSNVLTRPFVGSAEREETVKINWSRYR